jgi:hypothetical protein
LELKLGAMRRNKENRGRRKGGRKEKKGEG